MISFSLLLVFALGLAGIVWAQADIIRRGYLHRKSLIKAKPQFFTVSNRIDWNDQHFSLFLQPQNNNRLESFKPGQYITLLAQTQAETSRLQKRRYSLAAWQKNLLCYELCISREQDGHVSNWLHQNLHTGANIEAYLPDGKFFLDLADSKHSVLIAGGIGITPLRAMVQKFIFEIDHTTTSAKSMSLFYAAKSLDKMCFHDEFKKLAEDFPAFRFYPIFSQTAPHCEIPTGRLSVEMLQHRLRDEISVQYYMCGPVGMMEGIVSDLIQAGVPENAIHREQFGVGAALETDEIFQIDLGGGKTICFEQQRSLLEALEQNEIEIESECRSGECGQCKLKLHAGKVKQLISPDVALASNEILACCCVPVSDLHIERFQ